MIEKAIINDDNRDNHVDAEIIEFLNINNPKSFFLFAGAGSGKTRSLVNVLKEMRINIGEELHIHKQRIAVITYTNAACDEINSRVDYDPLFEISTIHSFVWGLIKPYTDDIKKWLYVKLENQIEETRILIAKGRPGTKIYLTRQRNIEVKLKRLDKLKNIKKFIYSPNGDNTEKDALNHTEVIGIGASFILEKILMQKIIIRKFPIILIDESQDTNKVLMEALLKLQEEYSKKFSLGLFGDTMQRIYADGKVNLGENLPDDWMKPVKIMNHRCPKRIVKLINKIRYDVDKQEQKPRSDSEVGIVRFFIASFTENSYKIEQKVTKKMMEITEDAKWNGINADVKHLTLEHHMVSSRLGFDKVFSSLYSINKYKTDLLNGDVPGLRFFTNIILPIVRSK